jgi:FtsZ-binding cell division protein ZapB
MIETKDQTIARLQRETRELEQRNQALANELMQTRKERDRLVRVQQRPIQLY